ncbi:XkdQ/YqbQ family protein [Anaerotignum sp. MB30-C6]|uniref:XkdQ/YqbQ family protein n=1 Tax=Anaerotignum sp. MB30-C6 TaxID=3070814 RepID=UPI0027DAE063|nr:hypothetical protein [Anaerotignum sp. MB30-C6]WMI81603.1 hypothetical protein RBQ60_02370 [Anaerotignum sp. MB30-C6]
MKVWLIKKNTTTDITGLITSVTNSGEYRSCCRSLSFGIIHSDTDKRTWLVEINVGDNIKVEDEGKDIFHGVVFKKTKATGGKEIDFTCHDYGIYLKKNKGSYIFKNMKPEDIAKKVCGDFGVKVGSVAVTGVPVSRNFIGVDLYSIIMTSYTLANDEKYFCEFIGNRLYVKKKGEVECKPLTRGGNLLTSSVTESLEGMVNRVRVYNKDDKLIQEIGNEEDYIFGFMTEYIRVNDSKEDYRLKAKKMLQGVERKITVTNFGDHGYHTGKKVIVAEPYTRLKGVFYIDADQHNWKNGIYTNKLTLNFQKIMDEKESGSDGQRK